ncbi:MAG: hypothetical protein ISR58_09855 [Anaerolineales bacterium]|nr:hypothetical protein [Chloroflexota bacterium]MBL6981478.1 hypothetical protein [Anaerolineales bacterium]
MKTYQFGWIILLILAVLACTAVSDVAEKAAQVESAAQTAQALATAGQNIISTVEGSGIVQTADAMGLFETMQAAITDIPEEGSNLVATAQVVITEGAYGEAPSNIPVVGGEISDFFGSSSLVSYTTPMDLGDAVDFYRNAMPNYGWNVGDDTTVLTSTYAVLSYKNADQRCTITLSKNPLNDDTIVLISIF